MAHPKPEEALEFLNEYGTKKRSPRTPISPKRFLLLAVAGVIIIGLIVTIFSLLFGGSSNTDRLVGIAASQQDMQRWSLMAADNARTPELLNSATSLASVMGSDNTTLRAQIEKMNVKKVDSLVNKKLDKDTDAKLDRAIQNNRFDTELREVLNKKLVEYKKELATARKEASSKQVRELMILFDQKVALFNF